MGNFFLYLDIIYFMHLLSIKFNLINTNSNWNQLKKNKVLIDQGNVI